MTDKDRPRLIVTGGVFALFAYVLYHNVTNEMLIGAMIGALTTAVAFWLGSSKGSSDKSTAISDITHDGIRINNTPNDPVPTKIEEE